MTCYVAVALDIKQAGAEYVDQEVVVDGNLVTSRAWPDLPAFIRELKAAIEKVKVNGALVSFYFLPFLFYSSS